MNEEEERLVWEEYAKAVAVEQEKYNLILVRIKELCGSKFHDLFLEYMHEFKEAGDLHGWDIVTGKPPVKRKQKIDSLPRNSRLTHEWCNQYCNGGMEGDSFAGQVWIHLKGNRYFTFHYSM